MKGQIHKSEDGVLRPCTAQPGNCRLEHWDTMDEAEAVVSKRLEQEHGTFATVKKSGDYSTVAQPSSQELKLHFTNVFGPRVKPELNDVMIDGKVAGLKGVIYDNCSKVEVHVDTTKGNMAEWRIVEKGQNPDLAKPRTVEIEGKNFVTDIIKDMSRIERYRRRR